MDLILNSKQRQLAGVGIEFGYIGLDSTHEHL